MTVGDEAYCSGRPIGTLAGFDETHMPNHLNIVIKSNGRMTGVEHGASLGDAILFKHKNNLKEEYINVRSKI